jgi:hypothetical protein
MTNRSVQWFTLYGYQEPYAPGESLDDVMGDDSNSYYVSRRDETKEVSDAIKAGAVPFLERYIIWACATDDDGRQELVEVPEDWNQYFLDRPFLFEKLLAEAPRLGGERKLVGYLVSERSASARLQDSEGATELKIPGNMTDRYELLSVGVIGQVSSELLDEGALVLTQMTGHLAHLHLVFGIGFSV